MDHTLRELLMSAADKEIGRDESLEFDIALIETTGDIEIELPDGPKRYVLMPLQELFGKDRPPPGGDWQDDERIMALLMEVERSILEFFTEADPDLTDSHVALVLSRLALRPGCEPGDDALCRCIQAHLRLFLSLRDYSRQEVRWALHKIERSVQLHRSLDGPQGYLTFITEQLGGD